VYSLKGVIVYYLFLYQVVAADAHCYSTYLSWSNVGTFSNSSDAHAAAEALGFKGKPDQYKVVFKG
jgi:hypothetical protein